MGKILISPLDFSRKTDILQHNECVFRKDGKKIKEEVPSQKVFRNFVRVRIPK